MTEEPSPLPPEEVKYVGTMPAAEFAWIVDHPDGSGPAEKAGAVLSLTKCVALEVVTGFLDQYPPKHSVMPPTLAACHMASLIQYMYLYLASRQLEEAYQREQVLVCLKVLSELQDQFRSDPECRGELEAYKAFVAMNPVCSFLLPPDDPLSLFEGTRLDLAETQASKTPFALFAAKIVAMHYDGFAEDKMLEAARVLTTETLRHAAQVLAVVARLTGTNASGLSF